MWVSKRCSGVTPAAGALPRSSPRLVVCSRLRQPHARRAAVTARAAEDDEVVPETSEQQSEARSNMDQRARMLLRRQRRLSRRKPSQEDPEAAAEEAGVLAEDDATPTQATASTPRAASVRSLRSSRVRRRSAARPFVPAPLTAEDILDEDEDTALPVEPANDSDNDADDLKLEEEDEDALLGAAGSDDDAEAAELQGMMEQARGVAATGPAGSAATTSSSSSPRQSSSPPQWQSASKSGQAAGPVQLSERSPMYLPVLTDEDLEADPPGHKSGYVAVIGKPNAGKSTLINAIVGQKLSIVTFKPQTTRHRVVGIASEKEFQMILFDTPGIMREQRSKLDERMMQAVVSSIKAAEAIVAVVDAADNPQEALGMFQPGPEWDGPPMAVLLNKADLVTPQQLEALAEWYRENCRAQAVFVGSAKEGAAEAAVGELKAWAVQQLPEGPTLYPKSMVSEQPERFFVSEIIREKIFLQYSEEIPYASQVVIRDFTERPGAKDYIVAQVMVERASQKGILVGRGGRQLKALGEAARADIEAFLERPVYLELTVEVAPDWRRQPDRLKEFGYFDPLYIS